MSLKHFCFNQIYSNRLARMDLNAFPDRVLRAVFDRVPLVDLVRHIPLVCHRWHSLQPSVLSGKKAIALTILVGPHAPRLIKEGPVLILYADELTNEDGSRMYPSLMDNSRDALSLTLSTLTSKLTKKLVNKFVSNVTYLEMCIVEALPVKRAIPRFIRLLDNWSQTLKTLKLHCSVKCKIKKPPKVLTSEVFQLNRMFDAVNTLPVLEHLTLTLFEDLRLTKSLNLPILGRLKEFHFYSSCERAHRLFRSLKRYAESNRQLRSIRLGNKGEVREYLAKFKRSSLAKRFTMLTCDDSPVLTGFSGQMHVRERESFLNKFTNLASFKICMSGLNLSGLTHTLAPLSSLVQLYIRSVEPFSRFDKDPVDGIRPLPSVKVLVLCATTRTHKDLASPHWARMFPQVQIIFLFHSTLGCSICGFKGEEFEGEKVLPCVQRTLLPLKQQFRRTLKKAYYSRDNDPSYLKAFTPDTI